MGAPATCPHCGAPQGGGARADPVVDALQDLGRQVALLRETAAQSARKDKEIQLLRETVARLRGAVARTRATAV